MRAHLLLPAVCLLASVAYAADRPATPPVADQTIAISAGTLAGLPRVKVEAREHDGPLATYEGVLLGVVLERAGIPRGEKLRGAALRAVVVVSASDGYAVVFTLPELDPAFTERRVVLADRKDGQSLPEREGPFRIVIPEEKRPARWIRNVRTIAITTVK